MQTTSSLDTRLGWMALGVAHCAGLIDLVALPLWIGALVGHFRLDAQQAGLLVTLFLAGCVAASLVLAPRFDRVTSPRRLAAGGFAVAALAFAMLGQVQGVAAMAGLHALAGLAVGTALTMTHGTQGRSGNPHRLFAVCAAALGVWALLFLSLMPQLTAAWGGQVLFHAIAVVMALGAVCSAALFPHSTAQAPAGALAAPGRMPRAVWGGVFGLALMSLVQAMGFSFLERAGADRGFTPAAVGGVLVALGLVNLFPAALAAALQRRLAPRSVLLAGPALQAVLAVLIFGSSSFTAYAVGAAFFVATILFTHVFAFGLLARLDPSGRVLAATPAMMMSGAALGPALAGTLVTTAGYSAIAGAAVCIAALAIACFSRLPHTTAASALPA